MRFFFSFLVAQTVDGDVMFVCLCILFIYTLPVFIVRINRTSDCLGASSACLSMTVLTSYACLQGNCGYRPTFKLSLVARVMSKPGDDRIGAEKRRLGAPQTLIPQSPQIHHHYMWSLLTTVWHEMTATTRKVGKMSACSYCIDKDDNLVMLLRGSLWTMSYRVDAFTHI